MKRFISILALWGCFLLAFADWTSSGFSFKGDRPQNMRTITGGVKVWYDGTLREVGYSDGAHQFECTGDVCVGFPSGYSGPKMEFKSLNGSVQIQYAN